MKNFWTWTVEDAFKATGADPKRGFSQEEAQAKLESFGPNVMKKVEKPKPFTLFLEQFASPISLTMLVSSLISLFLGEKIDSIIILVIMLLSALMSFLQENKAGDTVSSLLKVVEVTTNALRDGKFQEIPVETVIPGDIISLTIGDVIPADGLLIESRELYVDESTLTGETFPADKDPKVLPDDTPLAKRSNCLWMGTHVSSGSGKFLVIHTGKDTQFGNIASTLASQEKDTAFEEQIDDFGVMLMKITFIMMFLIFALNIFLGKPFFESFMFSLSLAIGMTPQLLPAIITITLSQGVKTMADHKVIVKKLNSIENFGSMSVLCTDKTGTITEGRVKVHDIVDTQGRRSDDCFELAYYNGHFQTGYMNEIDKAISQLPGTDEVTTEGIRLIDERQYNFTDKRMSVALDLGDDDLLDQRYLIITKGAFDKVMEICDRVLINDRIQPIAGYEGKLTATYKEYSNEGYRTLGLCTRAMSSEEVEQEDAVFDEEMVFVGFITLEDPLKPGMVETRHQLHELGVDLKIITGDNRYVAANIAKQLFIDPEKILTGTEIRQMSMEALSRRVQQTDLFAEIEPNQKQMIVEALESQGDIVGYMGDGINDAPALHQASVSISVKNAADVAKESADIVLMNNDLNVLIHGILEGRKTFANTLKYIFMTTSANFGNMFSMAGASLFLPFLPLLPKQVLLTNLLTDIPGMQIASDEVDESMLHSAHRMDSDDIRSFMILFGLQSSLFDFLIFAILILGLRANEPLFQTMWFIESCLSESVITFITRTRQPFYRSRPSRGLLWSNLLCDALIILIPYTKLGSLLGLVALQPIHLLIIAAILLAYGLSAENLKRLYYKKIARH